MLEVLDCVAESENEIEISWDPFEGRIGDQGIGDQEIGDQGIGE